MAISRVQLTGGGTSNYDTDVQWTLTLGSSPTVGNTLLIYINGSSVLNITSIVQGGSSASWSLLSSSVVANRNLYIYSLEDVPSGSSSSIVINLGTAANWFCAVAEEISGLADSSILDQTSTNNGTATNTYSTGSTPTTTQNDEYWVNIYSAYKAFGSAVQGSAPTNGYTIESTVNPVSVFDIGLTPSTPSLGFAPTFSAGLILAYQIVSSTGTAGGDITDALSSSSNYNSIAATFKSTSSPPAGPTRRILTSSWF